MALTPDVHLAGSFVNLNTETRFAVNQNFFIQNKSSKDVIIVRSLTQPIRCSCSCHYCNPIGGLDEDQSKRFRFPKRL